jgi:tRNA(Ile)-lysidine synthase
MQPYKINTSKSIISPEQIIPFVTSHTTIIVGFSGGPDSVCLLHLLAQLKDSMNIKLIAAHLDHGWRKESQADALWCQKFCKNLGIEYISTIPSKLDFQPKYNGSKEELGRKLRRYFFESLAKQYSAHAIALAHHADDQIETFFIRLLRGSSLSGLSGMRMHDGLYLRPLMNFNKSDILDYLKKHKIDYLTDNTNFEKNFLRNRIRLDLMPILNTIDSRWQTSIPSCIKQLQQADEFIRHQTNKIIKELASQDNVNQLAIQKFLEQDQIIQHKILLTMLIEKKALFTPSTALFQEIVRFLKNNQSKSHTLFEKYQFIKKQGFFYLVQI